MLPPVAASRSCIASPELWLCLSSTNTVTSVARAAAGCSALCAAQGPVISVSLSKNVSITGNVLAPAEHHAGGLAALTVDVITPDTVIAKNTFVNVSRESWLLPIAVGEHASPVHA